MKPVFWRINHYTFQVLKSGRDYLVFRYWNAGNHWDWVYTACNLEDARRGAEQWSRPPYGRDFNDR